MPCPKNNRITCAGRAPSATRTPTSGTIKTTKTEVPRWVPVHPTLAKILAEWKLSGWAQLIGRAPTADDFIMPDGPVLAHSSGVPLAAELQAEARAMVLKFKPGDPRMCRAPQNGLRRTHRD